MCNGPHTRINVTGETALDLKMADGLKITKWVSWQNMLRNILSCLYQNRTEIWVATGGQYSCILQFTLNTWYE